MFRKNDEKLVVRGLKTERRLFQSCASGYQRLDVDDVVVFPSRHRQDV